MDTDMWHYTCPVLQLANPGDRDGGGGGGGLHHKWIAQKFKGFESFLAHEHRQAGQWGSQTPIDTGTASRETHLLT